MCSIIQDEIKDILIDAYNPGFLVFFSQLPVLSQYLIHAILLYVNVNVMYPCAEESAGWQVYPQEVFRVKKTYSIRDMAREFNITTRTIRFYEEKGYLSPERDGTRRIYSAPDRTSLRLILRGKRLGLSLDETAELIGMYGSQQGNRQQLEKFILRISEKRAELERKQRDLKLMLKDLQGVEEKCQQTLAKNCKSVNNVAKVN
jgi:DNA-binding transcriptional MerR regulator